MVKYTRLMCIIIFIVLCGAIIYKQQMNTIESFLTYSNYPEKNDQMLLSGDYVTQPTPSISDNNASDIYLNTPIFPATSEYNNNIRYWKRPTNGKCITAEFCGNVYDDTMHTIPKSLQPPSSDKPRVNYYESSKLCE